MSWLASACELSLVKPPPVISAWPAITPWIVGADTTVVSSTIATCLFSAAWVSLVHLSWPAALKLTTTRQPGVEPVLLPVL